MSKQIKVPDALYARVVAVTKPFGLSPVEWCRVAIVKRLESEGYHSNPGSPTVTTSNPLDEKQPRVTGVTPGNPESPTVTPGNPQSPVVTPGNPAQTHQTTSTSSLGTDASVSKEEKQEQSEASTSSSNGIASVPQKQRTKSRVLTEGEIEQWRDDQLNDLAFLQELQADFPAVDVGNEIRRMCRWMIDNPDRRKTRRGLTRFRGSWLSRAQDRARGAGTTTTRRAPIAGHEVPEYNADQEFKF